MKESELYLVIISIFILMVYHLRLFWMVKNFPLRTDMGINACVRAAWVRNLLERPPGDVLPVQTLRNSLMSASFLASTAILLVAGLLGFALSEDNLNNFNHLLNMLSNGHPHVVLSRLLLLVADFFFAFFNFALCVRYYNHAGFMLNAGSSANGHALPEQFLISAMQHGALHFTLGMRAFLLVLPFGLWLLGPVWLLLGSIILIIVLWHIDFPKNTGIPSDECFIGKQPYKLLKHEP